MQIKKPASSYGFNLVSEFAYITHPIGIRLAGSQLRLVYATVGH